MFRRKARVFGYPVDLPARLGGAAKGIWARIRSALGWLWEGGEGRCLVFEPEGVSMDYVNLHRGLFRGVPGFTLADQLVMLGCWLVLGVDVLAWSSAARRIAVGLSSMGYLYFFTVMAYLPLLSYVVIGRSYGEVLGLMPAAVLVFFHSLFCLIAFASSDLAVYWALSGEGIIWLPLLVTFVSLVVACVVALGVRGKWGAVRKGVASASVAAGLVGAAQRFLEHIGLAPYVSTRGSADIGKNVFRLLEALGGGKLWVLLFSSFLVALVLCLQMGTYFGCELRVRGHKVYIVSRGEEVREARGGSTVSPWRALEG